MTKADLVEQVHEAIGPGVTKKDCAAVIARNPRTGESVTVPARAVPIFKPSRLFKKEVEEAF